MHQNNNDESTAEQGQNNNDPQATPDKNLPFWRVMVSVVQAAFGVQNPENKERDFSEGSIAPFVVAALLFTVAFVGCLMFIVSLVLGD